MYRCACGPGLQGPDANKDNTKGNFYPQTNALKPRSKPPVTHCALAIVPVVTLHCTMTRDRQVVGVTPAQRSIVACFIVFSDNF